MSSDGTYRGAESQKASSVPAALLCHPVAAPTPMASSPGSKRPFRTRMACTNCHSAKVKCSGERSGCVRCQDNSLNCEYEISMVGRMSTKRGKRRKQDKSTDGIQQQQQQHTQQSVTRSPSLTGDDPSQHQQLQSEQQQRRVGTVPQSPPHSDETFTPNTQTRTHDSSNAFDPLQEVIMNDAAESDLNKFFMFDYQGTDFDINSTLLGNPMLAPTPSSSNNFQADATTSSDTFHNDGEDMLGLVSELPSPFSTSLDSFQPACPISPPMTSSSSIPHDRGDMTAPASETSEHSHGSRSNSLGSASRQSWPSPLSVLIKIICDKS